MTFRLPLADRPDLVTYVNGEPALSNKALAYLCGVTEDEVTAEHQRQGRPTFLKLPRQWIRQGKETSARIGAGSVVDALVQLAAEREGGQVS